MTQVFMFFAFALMYLGALAVVAYLVHDGHPWFGVLVLVSISGASFSYGGKKAKEKAAEARETT